MSYRNGWYWVDTPWGIEPMMILNNVLHVRLGDEVLRYDEISDGKILSFSTGQIEYLILSRIEEPEGYSFKFV